jgi:hypothetical protein
MRDAGLVKVIGMSVVIEQDKDGLQAWEEAPRYTITTYDPALYPQLCGMVEADHDA